MKSIGNYLKDIRLKQEVTLEELSESTKIRLDYLKAIEEGKYEELPSAAFVKGFIRNYALALNAEPDKAMAIFRRDFDQNQKGKVVPRGISQPIAKKTSFWSPRTTTISLVFVLFIIASLYVANQVRTLITAPSITVNQPKDNQVFMTNDVRVSGKTRSDALLKVNSQPIILSPNGDFETTLNLANGEHTVLIEAESRDGKIREVTRTITIEAK